MTRRFFLWSVCLLVAFINAGCSGGGGGGDAPPAAVSSSTPTTGTLSLALTDARPLLPADVVRVLITFDEVRAHASGGDWVTLPLAQTPYTVDLLQFADGRTTDLVPPAQLTSGRYTQIRIGVTSATIVTSDGIEHPMIIPSENLKTDKNFEFDVAGGGAVTLTVDFDLSQSIVVTGSGTYRLRPVLHLVETREAASIEGRIRNSAFQGVASQAVVTIVLDNNGNGSVDPGDEDYTSITVAKTTTDTADPTSTPFRVFWLVPNQSYIVQIRTGDNSNQFVYQAALPAGVMLPSTVYQLNGGSPVPP